jgi:choline dehydrogenase-like flavoprotein
MFAANGSFAYGPFDRLRMTIQTEVPEGARAAPKRPIALAKIPRAVLDAVVDTFVPPDADLAMAQTMVATALDRLAPHRRAKLATVLSLLGNPGAMLALAGVPRSFARLDRLARERALRRLFRIAPLRPAFAAFGRLALFAAYAAADEQGHSAVWDRVGYPGPRADVPAGEAFPLAEPPPGGRLAADAVVVGSGAGGGVAAALLAQAGLRVVVLEAGGPFEPVAARQREAEAFGELYLERGLCASDDGGVSILAGACVGGGTAVNWSTSLRLPAALAAEWGRRLGRPAFAGELADAYDAVETRLGVTPASSHNRNNAVLAEGCAKLGWSCRAIPRNAECSGDRCGYCGFGCAYGNKRSTAATYLRDAVAHGAQVYARAHVERVIVESGGEGGQSAARGVEATLEDGTRLIVGAPIVVVAAGALRTPGILARSGVSSPHLGKHLHLHPVTAISAQFDAPVEPWHGAMQTAVCDEFAAVASSAPASETAGYGVVIEVSPSHPGLMASALPWKGRYEHAATMSSARYRATMIAIARDRGEGSVGLDERADVRYRIADDDAQRLADGVAAAACVAFAAGARSVATLHADQMTLDAADASESGLQAFAAELRARAAKHVPVALFSAHQMGTARMGASAADGAIDPDGRVYGVDGLIVTDASAFPTASGVNPMLTIMALAHRATSALIARGAAASSSGSPAPARS